MSTVLYLSENDRLQLTRVAGGRAIGALLQINIGDEHERIGREGARQLYVAIGKYLQDLPEES